MHYKSVQAGRAIAALMVMFFHLGGAIAAPKYFGVSLFERPFSFGYAGVHFFFVLSGFIIMHVHMDDLFKPDRFMTFLMKRCIRIYPVYLLIFAGVSLSALALPSLRNSVPDDVFLILKALALFPLDKSVVGGTGAPVLGVAWSLQYEVYFYILFGLSILSRKIALALLILLAVGLLFRLGDGGFPANFIWSDWIILFFFGVIVAVLVRCSKDKVLKPTAIIGVSLVILAALATIELIGGNGDIRSFSLLYGLGFAGLILGFVRYEQTGQPLLLLVRHQATQIIGDASYFLYLIHFPLISLLCKVTIAVGLSCTLGASVAFVLIAVCRVLIAIAGHIFVERTLQKWLSLKLIRRTGYVA